MGNCGRSEDGRGWICQVLAAVRSMASCSRAPALRVLVFLFQDREESRLQCRCCRLKNCEGIFMRILHPHKLQLKKLRPYAGSGPVLVKAAAESFNGEVTSAARSRSSWRQHRPESLIRQRPGLYLNNSPNQFEVDSRSFPCKLPWIILMQWSLKIA